MQADVILKEPSSQGRHAQRGGGGGRPPPRTPVSSVQLNLIFQVCFIATAFVASPVNGLTAPYPYTYEPHGRPSRPPRPAFVPAVRTAAAVKSVVAQSATNLDVHNKSLIVWQSQPNTGYTRRAGNLKTRLASFTGSDNATFKLM